MDPKQILDIANEAYPKIIKLDFLLIEIWVKILPPEMGVIRQ